MLSCFFKQKKKKPKPIQVIAVHKNIAVEDNPQSKRYGHMIYVPYNAQRDLIINRNIICELRESPEYSNIPRIN